MPSFCAYSDCVCYYWWSHVNALILCIFWLCVYYWWSHVNALIFCIFRLRVRYYWWSHVNALMLCIFRLCVLLLMVTCKCPHLVHIQIVRVITDGHMQIPSFCAYSDCVCYYWWSHVNVLILCIFRLCVLSLMVTCKCPHVVHIQIVRVITDCHI